MIRALRVRHRIAATVMAVGLPILFGSALAVRRPPRQMEAPPVLAAHDLRSWIVTGFQSQMFGALPVQYNQIADQEPPRQAGVELVRSAPWAVPDPLLYWSVEKSEDERTLPIEAYLVGAVGADETQRFALPADALLRNGWLFMYSLAHQEVVARAAWPSLIFVEGETSP